jgi:hypothetical protein
MFRALSLLQDIQQFIESWLPIVRDYAVALGIIAASLGVAYIIPGIRAKLAALLVAGAVITTTIAYGIGQKRGADRVQSDWDYSVEAARKSGEQDRADAVRDLGDRAPDERVRQRQADPWNRDNRAKPEGEGGAVRGTEAP